MYPEQRKEDLPIKLTSQGDGSAAEFMDRPDYCLGWLLAAGCWPQYRRRWHAGAHCLRSRGDGRTAPLSPTWGYSLATAGLSVATRLRGRREASGRSVGRGRAGRGEDYRGTTRRVSACLSAFDMEETVGGSGLRAPAAVH